MRITENPKTYTVELSAEEMADILLALRTNYTNDSVNRSRYTELANEFAVMLPAGRTRL